MRFLVWLVFLLVGFNSFSQESYYSKPLDIQILISGSFAELRSNHFHSGIDIKTEGRTGLPVRTVADGYVSRISVSPNGFGNAVYINHPNNTTSVYGHLEKFNEKLAAYVKTIQYKRESFTVDIEPQPHLFPVKKSDLIAFSGNSGSSGGPHLHFELRESTSQEPFNPFSKVNWIKDEMPPNILNLKIYPLNSDSHVNSSQNEKTFSVVKYNGSYHIKKDPIIPLYGKIGFGIRIVDYITGTWAKCGINYLEVRIDGKKMTSFEINKFSFSNTRYLNAHIDYGEYITKRRRFHKTWLEPGSKLRIITHNKDGIEFVLEDNSKHNVEILVKDSQGNTSTLDFTVKNAKKHASKKALARGTKLFRFDQQNIYNTDSFSFESQPGTFYSDFEWDYISIPNQSDSTLYSTIHKVHRNTTPAHKNFTIKIKPTNLPTHLHEKAVIVNIDEKNGRKTSGGGAYANGWVTRKTRSFGTYAIAIDTIAPGIRSLSIRNNQTLVESNRIRFKINDSLTGIKSYKGYIDGKWALFEFDAKNSLLTYHIDKERLQTKHTHTLQLTVTDYKNNSKTYKATFYK